MPTNRFINLLAEDDGTLWIGTEEHGLFRYRHREFQTFTVADGWPANGIHDIQKDVEGSLLIVTQSGLARFKDGRLKIEPQQGFRDYKIYVAPSGARWELDASGLRKISEGLGIRFEAVEAVSGSGGRVGTQCDAGWRSAADAHAARG